MPADGDSETSPALPRGFLRPGAAPASCVYLCPAAPRRGGGVGACEVLVRRDGAVSTAVAPVEAIVKWAWDEGEDVGVHVSSLLERLKGTPPPFAGLTVARPRIMGVVNVTPDSFADGGETPDAEAALRRGRAFAEAGADILDVGGESTRPGAAPLSVETEMERVLPVVRGLAVGEALVSVDTRHAPVMQAACESGARIINDVTALAGDRDSLETAARTGASVILMHMQGEPSTMQKDPRYGDAALDVYDYLWGRIAACEAAGFDRARIAIDPGIGFGKTVEHNLRILSRLALFRGLGCALVLGVSRKSFIARLSHGAPVGERLGGSLAAALAGTLRGANILRVHDVAETRQALDVWQAIAGFPGSAV